MRVDTAAAVGKYIWCSCGSEHCLLQQDSSLYVPTAPAVTAPAGALSIFPLVGPGSGEVLMELLRERTLLRQWGNNGKAPAGAGTAAAVGKYILCSCGSRHCCGSGEIYLRSCGSRHCCGSGGKQEALLLEQTLLQQWGKYM